MTGSMRTFVADRHQKSKMITSRWTNVWEYGSEIRTQGELRYVYMGKWKMNMRTNWRQYEDQDGAGFRGRREGYKWVNL